MAAAITYRPLRASDIGQAVALWERTPGVHAGLGDDAPTLRRYLKRNPGCNWAAECGGVVCGTILGGHDGRRGTLIHLAVEPVYRRRGIGRGLVERALAGMAQAGVPRVRVDVFTNNRGGLRFWRDLGFTRWTGVASMSVDLAGGREPS